MKQLATIYYAVKTDKIHVIRTAIPTSVDHDDRLPCVEVVVPLVYRLCHFLHASRIVLLINCYQFLRQLIEQFDLMFILVKFNVVRLKVDNWGCNSLSDRYV